MNPSLKYTIAAAAAQRSANEIVINRCGMQPAYKAQIGINLGGMNGIE